MGYESRLPLRPVGIVAVLAAIMVAILLGQLSEWLFPELVAWRIRWRSSSESTIPVVSLACLLLAALLLTFSRKVRGLVFRLRDTPDPRGRAGGPTGGGEPEAPSPHRRPPG